MFPEDTSYQTFTDGPGCDPQYSQTSLQDNKQFLEATIIRRHRSAGRSRIDCHRWEEYLLANSHPSIKTVEASANAKIFCETYFDSLKSKITSREERHREFEIWLQSSKLTPTLYESYTRDWFAKESIYLRRSRKLKIRSRLMTMRENSMTPGGFNVIQVLGKGSFGTVCLVQDLSAVVSLDESSSDASIDGRARSDQNFNRPYKRSRKHHLFKSHRSADELQQQGKGKDCAVYAMKIIRKTEMITNSQEGHVRAERDFLVASAKSKWVVDLFASFQDKTNLYLVMEYMVGGDFLSLLIKFDTLSEKHTRWYIAEMVLCVEAVHSLGWIHRDIKPDNFLVSRSGHLKIADFGLAFDGHWSHDQMYYHSQRYSVLQKLNIPVIGDEHDAKIIKGSLKSAEYDEEVYLTPREREATLRHDPATGNVYGYNSILQWRDDNGRRDFARSLVGTSQYMAPEVIKGLEYDGRCDWWSVGIILYECLFGHAPFYAKDRDITKDLIMSHMTSLQVPPRSSTRKYQDISKSAIHLIKSLLTDRDDRLSSWQYRKDDLVIPQSNFHERAHQANSHGFFVFEDDAQDIKKHRFFSGLKWHRLHLERPPFVPSIQNRADTKYFDQEATGTESGIRLPTSSDDCDDKDDVQLLDGCITNPKCRARDRILRDKVYKMDALKLRKQHAFLGYTYHRPPPARPSISLIA